MSELPIIEKPKEGTVPFYSRPQVELEELPIGPGIPMGIERVSNPDVGIAGVYGAWGNSYDNLTLLDFIREELHQPIGSDHQIDLSSLGFNFRHLIPVLSHDEDIDLEVAVGAKFLREAAQVNGWEPAEVEAVLLGMTAPVTDDYTERVAREAGIPESAMKVSVHKACDSSVGALHMALNPNLDFLSQIGKGLADKLAGKKVLIGGIEGLSRILHPSKDINALQLFGNGVGVFGLIPGKTIKLIVGKTHEVYDENGVLAVHMYYPYHREKIPGESLVEVTQAGNNHIRVAGLMNEPDQEDVPVEMAGLMGMVKLFVRNGVQVVGEVYRTYCKKMEELGTSQKSIITTIVHHANYKINSLMAIQLEKEGIPLSLPWVLSDFGNVSAASTMIAFMRQLSKLKSGDNILFDGFGAGTYYDVLVVTLGGN